MNLLEACNRGDIKEVKRLVEQGVDFHSNNEEALRWAAFRGHLEIVKYLIEKGADVHGQNDLALKWAAAEGHLEVVRCLVEHGADIHNFFDEPLRIAIREGRIDVIKYLLEQGVDIRKVDFTTVASKYNYKYEILFPLFDRMKEDLLPYLVSDNERLRKAVSSYLQAYCLIRRKK
jgi:ankyrin repeat protein